MTASMSANHNANRNLVKNLEHPERYISTIDAGNSARIVFL